MKELNDIIIEKGVVLDNNILKVDAFLNQQIDINIMKKIGDAFYEHFKNKKVTKILTVESSGIAPSIFSSIKFNCPVVFARKHKSLTTSTNIYKSSVYSYTKEQMNEVMVSRDFLCSEDNVLIIDDFIANGQASKAMIALCNQAGANICGVGIVIEKTFQKGRSIIEDLGIEVYSLSKIKSLDNKKIEFEED